MKPDDVLKHLLIERRICNQVLQLRILSPALHQASHLADLRKKDHHPKRTATLRRVRRSATVQGLAQALRRASEEVVEAEFGDLGFDQRAQKDAV